MCACAPVCSPVLVVAAALPVGIKIKRLKGKCGLESPLPNSCFFILI